MIKYLSYILSDDTPVYGAKEKGVLSKEIKSLSKGDSAAVFSVSFENHWGTHVDCPAHFFMGAKKAVDYGPEEWIFRNPQVIDINASSGKIITIEDIGRIAPRADLLLLRTGWSRFRGKDIYSLNNPGVSSEVGIFLRKNYPKIRGIGLDCISLSSYAHRESGREAHKAFLDPKGYGAPLIIIEDMFLSDMPEGLKEVWVSPMRIEGIDSAPCTVIGVFE